ncbi:MAG: hypothetical protein NXI31_24845 [bacterium]|nr:hypothetical protein [bacterium]
MLTKMSLVLAVTTALPLFAQSPTPWSDGVPDPERFTIGRVPIHAADPVDGKSYGLRAAADSYKARFDQGATFTPYLGRDYPRAQSWKWRTESVRIGGHSLIETAAAPAHWHSDYRYEYRFGAVTEAYDVRDDGLEQTFVVHQRPATAGDLVVVGSVTTDLSAPRTAAAHTGLTFHDADGAAIVRYGAAIAIDANGQQLPITTAHRDAEITLTVPGHWLETARYPITIDPLLTRVSVISSSVLIDEVDVCHSQTSDTTLISFARLAAATLYDLYVLETDSNYSAPTVVHTDLGSYNTPYARISATGSTFAVVMQRNLTAGRRLAMYVHQAGSFTDSTVVHTLSTPAGFDDWRPDVSGNATGSRYFVVFQRDDQANTSSSDVMGRYVTPGGTVTTPFAIAAGCSDVEWPSVSQYEFANVIALNDIRMVVWQRQPCALVPRWVEGKLVDFNGNVSTATWASANNVNTFSSTHVAHPLVAGRNGRYLVATTIGTTFPERRGRSIELERVDWATLNSSPTAKPSVTLAGPFSTQRVRTGGIAFDDDTRSHWAVTTDHNHDGTATGFNNGYGYIDRVGFNGASTRRHAIQSAGNPDVQAQAGGISYSQQEEAFRFGWSVADSGTTPINTFAWINRMTRPAVAAPAVSGMSCTTALPSWTGSQLIGAELPMVRLTGALPTTPALLVIAFSTDNTDLTQFGMPGCRLLVTASGAGHLATLFTLTNSLSEASFDFPLPEFLGNGSLFYQWFFVEPGVNATDFVSTQRLQVDIVK